MSDKRAIGAIGCDDEDKIATNPALAFTREATEVQQRNLEEMRARLAEARREREDREQRGFKEEDVVILQHAGAVAKEAAGPGQARGPGSGGTGDKPRDEKPETPAKPGSINIEA